MDETDLRFNRKPLQSKINQEDAKSQETRKGLQVIYYARKLGVLRNGMTDKYQSNRRFKQTCAIWFHENRSFYFSNMKLLILWRQVFDKTVGSGRHFHVTGSHVLGFLSKP
jgi:hypothetical protein